MVTTATLQLFKNCAYDIYRNMSNFTSLTAQNNYYNGLAKLEKDVVFNKIGDPFILDEDIATLSEYTYGRIQYAGMWWYFQIMNMGVNAQGRTVIAYQLDAWETHRYQGNLKLGAGQVTRRGDANVNGNDAYADFEIIPPFEPNDFYIEDCTDRSNVGHGTGGGYYPCVFAFVRNNTTDWCLIVCCRLNDLTVNERNAFLVNTSAIIKYINDVLPDIGENLEIVGAWYSSYCPNMDGTKWVNTEKNGCWYADVLNTNEDLTYTLSASMWYDRDIPTSSPTLKNSWTDKIERFYIADERGNAIFTFADNVYYGSSVHMILNITMSSCQWLCAIHEYDIKNNVTTLKGTQTFTLPCEPLDFYNDSWYQYQATQRQMDIDMRSLETKNQAVNGLANVGSSIIGGAVAGTMLAPGVGTAIGAVGGAVASLIGTGASALYSTTYANNKEQGIIDKSYKKAGDALNLNGNGVNGSLMVWVNQNNASAFRIWQSFGAGYKTKISDETFNKFLATELNTYGRYYDIRTDDCDDCIMSDCAFTANCEVTGVPADWAGQVQERLANGVMFK